MLTHIRMQNFKSWQDTGDIRIAPLTGFFGANSSGKTSILQMLLMLKATTESNDRNNVLETNIKDYVDLGNLDNIISYGENRLTLSLGWDLRQPIQVLDQAHTAIEFSTHIRFRNNTPYTHSFSYGTPDNHPTQFVVSMTTEDNGLSYITTISSDNNEKKRSTGHKSTPVKCYDFPDDIVKQYANTLNFSDIVFLLEKRCSDIYHLGPIRDITYRSYNWGGNNPSNIGIRGKDAIFALLAGGEAMITKIDEWLSRMGLSRSFNIRKVIGTTYQVELKQGDSERPVLLPDMGFGVSQVLPVLVACYHVPQGSTLLIEQPEMHLHPSAQAVLADMFIEVIQERHVQIILESHSEHLLTRLQLRIAEGKVNSENETALYFCDFKDGVSHLQSLEVDLFGEIQNYPHEFFGDLAGDVINRAIVGAERRMQGQV